MEAEGIDVLVVAGNPWRSDYLRYAVDLTPTEGQVFALVEREGQVQVVAGASSRGGALPVGAARAAG